MPTLGTPSQPQPRTLCFLGISSVKATLSASWTAALLRSGHIITTPLLAPTMLRSSAWSALPCTSRKGRQR